MSGNGTATDRLDRILLLLPLAIRETEERGGIAPSALARRLGTDVETVLEDLEEIVARDYYLPPGLGDALQITLDRDRISVRTTGEFGRPVRLTRAEAMALGVALRSAALDPEGDPAGARALARRLERELAVPREEEEEGEKGRGSGAAPDDRAAGRSRGGPRHGTKEDGGEANNAGEATDSGAGNDEDEGDEGGEGNDGGGPPDPPLAVDRPTGRDARIHALLERGVRERRVCRLRYLKPGRREPETRHLSPWRLAYAEGAWYAVGHSRRADDVRVFRLDRILEASLTGESFEPPEDFDPEELVTDGRLFRADDEREALVRYSPVVARWIREAWPVEEEEEDGGVRVRHRVADPAWLVGHVLRLTGEAEVLEPADLRAAVREAAERLAG